MRFLDHAAAQDRVWFARRIDIARHWTATHPPRRRDRPSRMDRAAFVARLGGVFEHSPWIAERAFALELGATWAGDTRDRPGELLDAIIDTTPAWLPVIAAMEALAPGGRLVINAIRKEADDRDRLLDLDYERHLWREKTLTTVANVTRNDVRACLELAATIPLRPSVTPFRLDQANQALLELRQGHVRGAKVLVND